MNYVYLSNGIQLKIFGSFICNSHLKILGQFDFDPSILCSDKCLESIFICASCMQDLQNRCRRITIKLKINVLSDHYHYFQQCTTTYRQKAPLTTTLKKL